MSFKLLKIVFKVGRLVAMTPRKIEGDKVTLPSLPYVLFIVGFYSLGIFICGIYRHPAYLQLSKIKLVVQFFLDLFLYCLNVCITLTVIRKKEKWCQMLKNLRMTEHENLCEATHYVGFVGANILYIALMVYETWIYSEIMGFDFYKQYAVEYLQMYSQFLTYFLLYILLQMLLMRYRYIRRMLSGFQTKRLFSEDDYMSYLRKMKHDICMLGETTNLFNDLFGWPMLLIICFTSLQMLQHLESIFVLHKDSVVTIVYAVNFLLWHFVFTFNAIFLCDSVRNEVEKILFVAYKLETHLLKELRNGHEEMRLFINVVNDNFPNFSAARFFDINRKTIFRIFNAVVTFLIVMIQFENTEHTNIDHINFQNCKCNNTQ